MYNYYILRQFNFMYLIQTLSGYYFYQKLKLHFVFKNKCLSKKKLDREKYKY